MGAKKHVPIVIHFDMDCFYAQVEEGRNPALRGRPLGVRQKRILATCNYAARRRGVRKMDSVVRALQACPELVIVSGENLAPYRDASQRIFDLLRREVPAANVQRLGLDEFFVDVSAALSAEPSSATLGLTRGEPLTPSSRSTGAAASEKSANWHGHVIRAGWQPVAAAMAARDPARAQAAVTAQPTRSADTDEGGKASAATPTLQAAVGGDYGSTGDGDSDGDVSGEEESALAGSLAQSPVSRASTSMTAGDSSADAEYDCDAVENALRAATVLAARLRTVIRTQLGYTCCAGIAVNKTMAKVAGELHKPDQQTCVLPEAHDAVLAQRELKQIPGLGRAMRSQLRTAGIVTMADLRATPRAALERLLGPAEGTLAYDLCRGQDAEPVAMTGLAKTMSNEDNLGPCRDLNIVMAALQKLTTRLMLRVTDEYRLYNRLPSTFRLSACPQSYHNRISRQVTVDRRIWLKPVEERNAELMDLGRQLLQKMELRPFIVHVINVGVTNFTDASDTNTLDRFLAAKRPHLTESTASVCEPHREATGERTAATPVDEFHRQTEAEKELHEVDLFRQDGGLSAGGDVFACERCGLILPAFCEAPHRLFHQEEAGQVL